MAEQAGGPEQDHSIDLDVFAQEHGLTKEQVDELVSEHGLDRLKLKMAADGLKSSGQADNYPAPGQEWNGGAPRLMS